MAVVDPGLEFGLLGGAFFNNYVYRVDAARSVITLAPNQDMRGGLGERSGASSSASGPIRSSASKTTCAITRSSKRPIARRWWLASRSCSRDSSELEQQADALGVPQIWRD